MRLFKLPTEFYAREIVTDVARDLLGKVLCTHIDGRLTKAVITETEAYAGVEDRASHAFGGRRTPRTEPMFGDGGVAYVYLCYGIHHLFNVVTSRKDDPHAVLIRAGAPLLGTECMLDRRKKESIDKNLLAGPGSLACALGIRTSLTGVSLQGNQVWIEDHDIPACDDAITVGPGGLPDEFIHFQSEQTVLLQGASCGHSTAMAAARNAVVALSVHSLRACAAGPPDGVTSLGKGTPLPAQRALPANRQRTLKAYEFIRQPTKIGIDYAGDDAARPYRFVADPSTLIKRERASADVT